MKLKNLGQVYTLDSNDNFDLQKDITLSEDVMNFVNIILNYFNEVESMEIHSAYLRGSCLERNKIDRNTLDIDIVIVHENDLFQPYGYFDEGCINEIIEIMKSTYGFSIFPDVRIDHISHFLKQTQMRFMCKKVYGDVDLSISKRSKSEMLDWVDKDYDKFVNESRGYVQHMLAYINQKNYRSYYCYKEIRSCIKVFFRNLSIRMFLEREQYTKSLYNCYNVMLENYPNHRKDLEDIMNLFLNVEEYSKEKMIKDLNKILSFLDLQANKSKKSYRIKIVHR